MDAQDGQDNKGNYKSCISILISSTLLRVFVPSCDNARIPFMPLAHLCGYPISLVLYVTFCGYPLIHPRYCVIQAPSPPVSIHLVEVASLSVTEAYAGEVALL